MEKKQVPDIRFQGFTDAWEQRKLGEVADLLTGFPFESKKFTREGIKLVRGMNVKRGYLDFSEELCECWASSLGLESYLLKNGDILIQMDGALIGKSYAKIEENQLPALLVQRVTRARTLEQVADEAFIYQQIQKGFLAYIKGTKTETAVPHLSLSDIENFVISIPSVTEQKKVGSLFESLDHLITLHQRKYEKLLKVKKSMLEKMFPRDGADVPEIRFDEFTDAWEQRKLREVLTLLKDGTHGTHKDVEDGPLLLSAKNIKNGTIQWDASDRRISKDEYESIHANFKLHDGDVLLTIVGSIGETAILSHSEGLTFQRSVAFLRPDNELISEFLYSKIQGHKFQKELDDRKSTSAQPGIYLGDLGEIPISYPKNINEQFAIGQYFTSLDHLITLHQRELEKLKNIKKSLLEKMFV